MPNFHYKAYTSSGAVQHGQIAAVSRQEAAAKLDQLGLLPFECAERPQNTWSSRLTSLRTDPSLSTRELAEFTRSLAAFIRAELPIDVALRLVSQQGGSGRTRQFASLLHSKVTAGQSLAEAIDTAQTTTPAILANLVRAGEASGQLHIVLSELGDYFESRSERREQLLSAFIYPVTLVIAAIAALIVIIKILIPALLPLFEQSGAEAPLVLRIGAHISAFIDSYGVILLVLIIALLVTLRSVRGNERVSQALDSAFLRLPLAGTQYRKSEVALIARTLGVLLRHGVALVSALDIASNTASSTTLQGATRATMQGVKEGRRLPAAMAATANFPEVAIQMVAVGDEIGKLDVMLMHYAELTDKEIQRFIARAMALLSPGLTLAIGLLVGGLFVSVVNALLSVNQLVLQ